MTSLKLWSVDVSEPTPVRPDHAGRRSTTRTRETGGTTVYDPDGNLTAGSLPDDKPGAFDAAWHGSGGVNIEHQPGLHPMIQMGARQYSPTLARFLQVDPIEGGVNNDYGYVSDPINQSDLTGMSGHLGCQPGYSLMRNPLLWECIRWVEEWRKVVWFNGTGTGGLFGLNMSGPIRIEINDISSIPGNWSMSAQIGRTCSFVSLGLQKMYCELGIAGAEYYEISFSWSAIGAQHCPSCSPRLASYGISVYQRHRSIVGTMRPRCLAGPAIRPDLSCSTGRVK